MKIRSAIIIGMAIIGFAFTNHQEMINTANNSFESGKLNLQDKDVEPVETDTIYPYVLNQIVDDQLVNPLADCGKIERMEFIGFMDKSGHRQETTYQPVRDINYQLTKNGLIIIEKGQMIYGDISRLDGTFKSHLCSIKVDYTNGNVWARNTGLEPWVDAATYVDKMCSIKD